jgi:hypothetical protein
LKIFIFTNKKIPDEDPVFFPSHFFFFFLSYWVVPKVPKNIDDGPMNMAPSKKKRKKKKL